MANVGGPVASLQYHPHHQQHPLQQQQQRQSVHQQHLQRRHSPQQPVQLQQHQLGQQPRYQMPVQYLTSNGALHGTPQPINVAQPLSMGPGRMAVALSPGFGPVGQSPGNPNQLQDPRFRQVQGGQQVFIQQQQQQPQQQIPGQQRQVVYQNGQPHFVQSVQPNVRPQYAAPGMQPQLQQQQPPHQVLHPQGGATRANQIHQQIQNHQQPRPVMISAHQVPQPRQRIANGAPIRPTAVYSPTAGPSRQPQLASVSVLDVNGGANGENVGRAQPLQHRGPGGVVYRMVGQPTAGKANGIEGGPRNDVNGVPNGSGSQARPVEALRRNASQSNVPQKQHPHLQQQQVQIQQQLQQQQQQHMSCPQSHPQLPGQALAQPTKMQHARLQTAGSAEPPSTYVQQQYGQNQSQQQQSQQQHSITPMPSNSPLPQQPSPRMQAQKQSSSPHAQPLLQQPESQRQTDPDPAARSRSLSTTLTAAPLQSQPSNTPYINHPSPLSHQAHLQPPVRQQSLPLNVANSLMPPTAASPTLRMASAPTAIQAVPLEITRPGPVEPSPLSQAIPLDVRGYQNRQALLQHQAQMVQQEEPQNMTIDSGFEPDDSTLGAPAVLTLSQHGFCTNRLLQMGRALTTALKVPGMDALQEWVYDFFSEDAHLKFHLVDSDGGNNIYDAPVSALARFYSALRDSGAMRAQLLLESPVEYNVSVTGTSKPYAHLVHCDEMTWIVHYASGCTVFSRGLLRANFAKSDVGEFLSQPACPKIHYLEYVFEEHTESIERSVIGIKREKSGDEASKRVSGSPSHAEAESREMMHAMSAAASANFSRVATENESEGPAAPPIKPTAKRKRSSEDESDLPDESHATKRPCAETTKVKDFAEPSAHPTPLTKGDAPSEHLDAKSVFDLDVDLLLPESCIGPMGISDKSMRVLEIAEMADHLGDVFMYSLEHGLAPMEALEQYAAECVDSGAASQPQDVLAQPADLIFGTLDQADLDLTVDAAEGGVQSADATGTSPPLPYPPPPSAPVISDSTPQTNGMVYAQSVPTSPFDFDAFNFSSQPSPLFAKITEIA